MYNFFAIRLEAFYQKYRLWIAAGFVLLVAAAAFLRFSQKPGESLQPPAVNADSLNFVNARDKFSDYSAEFVRISKISGGLADQMRDSVNIYYRRADSLKTVYDQSKAR